MHWQPRGFDDDDNDEDGDSDCMSDPRRKLHRKTPELMMLDTTAEPPTAAESRDDDEDEDGYAPVDIDTMFEKGFCFICKFGVLDQDDGPVQDRLKWILERMDASVHMGTETAAQQVYEYYDEHVRHLLDDDACPEWTMGSIRDHFIGGHGTAEVATMKRMNLQFLPKAMVVLRRHLVLQNKRNPKKQRLNFEAWKLMLKFSKHIQQEFSDAT